MSDRSSLHRLAAFSKDPEGGNPAGVWVGDELPEPEVMQQIATEVGYSETAFVSPREGTERTIRYFSPLAEVSFCGHATIATGVLLGNTNGAGDYRLCSKVGVIDLQATSEGGRIYATLTSIDTQHKEADPELLRAVLGALRWHSDELDPTMPPAIAYAGAWHLVLAAATLHRLNQLDYEFETLKALMLENDLTTIQLVWRDDSGEYHSRNPFPVGGVVEDAATGAAAAAFGGYLRDSGLVEAPFRFLIRQGEVMGRPGRLQVSVPVKGGVSVSGTAAEIN